MKKALITDLDRTIIHSRNSKHICVEFEGDKAITFMSYKAIEVLEDLLNKKDFLFIPCTMRSLSKVMRIDFIRNYKPKFIICENGAQIFIDGTLDLVWENKMRDIVSSEDIRRIMEDINKLNLSSIKVLNINDYHIEIKLHNKDEIDFVIEKLKGLVSYPFALSQVGRKVYILHRSIDKSYAVKYLVSNFSITNFITSGDGVVDEKFTRLGKAILPQNAVFRHDNVIVTKRIGILATEEILEYARNEFYR